MSISLNNVNSKVDYKSMAKSILVMGFCKYVKDHYENGPYLKYLKGKVDIMLEEGNGIHVLIHVHDELKRELLEFISAVMISDNMVRDLGWLFQYDLDMVKEHVNAYSINEALTTALSIEGFDLIPSLSIEDKATVDEILHYTLFDKLTDILSSHL